MLRFSISSIFSSLTSAATAICETRSTPTMLLTHVSTVTQTPVEKATYNHYKAEWDADIVTPVALSGNKVDEGLPILKPIAQAWSIDTNANQKGTDSNQKGTDLFFGRPRPLVSILRPVLRSI